MRGRSHKKRPGRKPGYASAVPRRPRCRDCRFRALSGACLDPVLTSGRCGDWVWFVRGGKQHRRLYVKPANPRTVTQQRGRARFGATSRKYSESLTDEQRDACIAAGAKLRSHPRLNQSGPLTGQQYSIRREYAANAHASKQKTEAATKVPQLQRVTRKYKSQVPLPQRFTRSTPGLRRSLSGTAPGQGQRNTGRAGKKEGRRMNEECRRQEAKTAAEVGQPQKVTRSGGRHHRNITRAGRWQAATNSGVSPVLRRASVLARPNLSRPPAGQGARGGSPSRRRCRGVRRAAGGEAVWRRQRLTVGRGRRLRERAVAARGAIR